MSTPNPTIARVDWNRRSRCIAAPWYERRARRDAERRHACVDGVLGGVAALLLAATVTADDGRWRIASTAPFAVRGGVLAVEIEPLDPPTAWPSVITLRSDDGREIRAELGVVIAAPSPSAPAWTSPPDPIEVLTVDAFRARFVATGVIESTPINAVVVALAPMPADLSGSLAVAGGRVAPKWLDRPASDALESLASGASAVGSGTVDVGARGPASEAHSGSATRADDRPDPFAPGEYWRRVLLAKRAGYLPPAPPFDGPARLLAIHRGELWLAGVTRIERAGPSVAAALVELLTARVDDPLRPEGSRSIAAWISLRSELDALLAILLDPQRDADAAMRAALGWMESRTPLTCWLESHAGAAVTLAVANPLPEEVVVRAAWVEAPREAPIAMIVPARAVARHAFERPAPRAPGAPSLERGGEEPPPRWRTGLTLRLECGAWSGRLAAGPGLFAVRPPGLAFASFVPDLTLAHAQSQRLELPATPWRTTASLRRLGARWEVFVECLRPTPSAGDRVEIELRRGDELLSRFAVDERGSITTLDGASSAELAAHARSHADRWRVRLELPDAWMPPFVLGEWERVLSIALARHPGGDAGRQTAGLAVPSWRPPAPIHADLAAWRDMPAPSRR